jgi:hypothetical protein
MLGWIYPHIGLPKPMKLNRRVTNSASTQSHIISMVSTVRANPPFHFKIKYPVTIADLCHPTARYEAILNPGRFARICVDDEADAKNASFPHRIPPTHTALSRRHSAPGRILSPPHPWVAACNMCILCCIACSYSFNIQVLATPTRTRLCDTNYVKPNVCAIPPNCTGQSASFLSPLFPFLLYIIIILYILASNACASLISNPFPSFFSVSRVAHCA